MKIQRSVIELFGLVKSKQKIEYDYIIRISDSFLVEFLIKKIRWDEENEEQRARFIHGEKPYLFIQKTINSPTEIEDLIDLYLRLEA